MEDVILDVIAKTNRRIYLPKKQWLHITKSHPDMANYLEEIRETIKNPAKITDYNQSDNIKYYYKYFKHRESSNKYLLVVVKYLNGEGFIVTAYFMKSIK